VGLAQDLLQQANHLATWEGPNPSQASLRRAVSTAYYALFHLLIEQASLRWQGSSEAKTGMERGFVHGFMRNASVQFRNATWQDWHGSQQAVPPALRNVARAFVNLQDDRHTADYNNHLQWSLSDVELTLNKARSAFQSWESVSTDPMAGNYLLAMLLSKPRP
jgi:uncharacterized protein (UPF0332 family)